MAAGVKGEVGTDACAVATGAELCRTAAPAARITSALVAGVEGSVGTLGVSGWVSAARVMPVPGGREADAAGVCVTGDGEVGRGAAGGLWEGAFDVACPPVST